MTTCGVVDVVLWVVVVVRDGVIVVGGAEVEVEELEAGAVTVVFTAVAALRRRLRLQSRIGLIGRNPVLVPGVVPRRRVVRVGGADHCGGAQQLGAGRRVHDLGAVGVGVAGVDDAGRGRDLREAGDGHTEGGRDGCRRRGPVG